MKRPTNLEDANEIIEYLLQNLVESETNSAFNKVPYICCPYKVLGNPMKFNEDKDCIGDCETCKDEYWKAYKTMIYEKYKLED